MRLNRLMVSLFFSLIFSWNAHAWNARLNTACMAPRGPVVYGPGPIIWPWGKEMMFPWNGIEGVWEIKAAVCGNVYAFKIIRQAGSERFLDITQYDPNSCGVVARGKGFEANRVVRAMMNSATGAFQLTIHAFRSSDLGFRRASGPFDSNSMVLVMQLNGLSTPGRGGQSFELSKIGNNPRLTCE